MVISTSKVPFPGITPDLGSVVNVAKPWLRDSCPNTSHLHGSFELFVKVRTRLYGYLHTLAIQLAIYGQHLSPASHL